MEGRSKRRSGRSGSSLNPDRLGFKKHIIVVQKIIILVPDIILFQHHVRSQSWCYCRTGLDRPCLNSSRSHRSIVNGSKCLAFLALGCRHIQRIKVKCPLAAKDWSGGSRRRYQSIPIPVNLKLFVSPSETLLERLSYPRRRGEHICAVDVTSNDLGIDRCKKFHPYPGRIRRRSNGGLS